MIFGLAPLWSIAIDDIHRATQGPFLRRRLRRSRSAHRQRTSLLASRRKQPHRSRSCRRTTRRRTCRQPSIAWSSDRVRRLPHGDVVATKTTAGPRDDRLPVRLVHTALRQPGNRARPVAAPARRPPRHPSICERTVEVHDQRVFRALGLGDATRTNRGVPVDGTDLGQLATTAEAGRPNEIANAVGRLARRRCRTGGGWDCTAAGGHDPR